MATKAAQVESALAGYLDKSGNPLSSGKLYTYEAGTSNPASVYQDQDKVSAHANPVILDAQGQKLIFADGLYKFVLRDQNDNLIETFDNLQYFFISETTTLAEVISAVDSDGITMQDDGGNTGLTLKDGGNIGIKDDTNPATAFGVADSDATAYASSINVTPVGSDIVRIRNLDASAEWVGIMMEANSGTPGIARLLAQRVASNETDFHIQLKDSSASSTTVTQLTLTSEGDLTIGNSINVDNLKMTGNTISSEDSNGNIELIPNGTGHVDIGDSGSESGGISINGTTYDSALRVNDIGGSHPAQFIIHRHSTTLLPLILGARSNSDTSSHASVTNSQPLLGMYGAGWSGSHYDIFGTIDIRVDSSGTISSTSAPGAIVFKTCQNGSQALTTALTIDSNQNLDLGTNKIYDGGFNGNWDFNSGSLTNIVALTGVTDITMSGTLDLGTNTISDGVLTGSWNFDSGTLYVDSVNNRIGIGTASPGKILDIQGSSPHVEIKATDDTNASFTLDSGTNSDAVIILDDANTSRWAFGLDSDDSNKWVLAASGVLGSSNVLTITSGKVFDFQSGTLQGITTFSTGDLTVDNININGNTISSTSGDINLTPNSGDDVVIDSHWEFDGTVLTALTDSNTTITAYTGRNIVIESVTFDGGVVDGVTNLTMSGTLDLGINTVSDGNFNGNWDFNTGNITNVGTLAISGTLTGVTDLTMSGTIDLGTNTISDGVLTGSWNFDSNTLYIDSVNNRIGIGTASPSYQLEISGTEGVNITGSNARLYLEGQRVLEDISSGTRLDFAESYTGVFHRAANNYFGESSTVDTSRWINITTISESAYQRFEVYSATGSHSPFLEFVKSAGTTAGTLAQTSTNDVLGRVDFKGVNSLNDDEYGAIITSTQTAASGSKVPANLVLRTFSSSAENSNQLYLSSDGYVGIGLSSPSTTFDVRGEIVNSDGTYGVKLTYSAGDTTGVIDTYGNHDLEFKSNGSSAMLIDTSLRVGIGTSSPSSKLHVYQNGVSSDVSMKIENDQSGYAATCSIDANSNYSYASFSGSSKTWLVGQRGLTGGLFSIYDSDNTSHRLVIDADGKVGIGTSNPQGVLDLGNATGGRGISWGGPTGAGHYTSIWSEYGSGSLFIGSGVKGDTTAGQSLYSWTGTIGAATIELVTFGSNAGDIIFSGNPSASVTKDAVASLNEIMRIDASSSRVGIGTSSPGALLDIRSGDLDVSNGTYGITCSYSSGNTTGIIDSYGNHDIELRGNGSEVARVKSDGEFNVLTKFDNGERTYRINATSDADDHFITAHTYLGTRGGVILVEPGSYSMNDAVTISNNAITIRGSGTGANGTTLNATSSSSVEDMFSVSGSDITFENIEFDATSAGYGVYLVDYSGSGQITFKNCIFREGGTASVRIQSGYALFEQCIFEVGDDSGDIGIANTGGRTKVIGCDFDADLDGTGIGIQHTGGYLWVSDCYFNDLDIAIDAGSGSAEIYQNSILDCDHGIYCDPSGNNTVGLKVNNNRLSSCNTRGVYIEAFARECQIINNIISEQAGTSCVEITGPATVDVSGNTMRGCTSSYGIYINDSKGSHTYPMSIKVDNNQLSDFSNCTYAIYVDSPTPSSAGFGLGRSTSICGNNLSSISDNGNVTGIYTISNGVSICNNVMDHFHCQDSAANLRFIDSDGGNMTINNNVIFSDSSYNTNSTVYCITFGGSGSNTAVVGNTIEVSTDSGNNTYGIYETGTCAGCTIVGNTIAVTVSGAGTGNAFNISETEGVAGLNDYSQSDSIGTLSISSGVVVDNNA